MAQYRCPICGTGFEQRSAYERHMQTSHPEQSPSAADLEHALAGVDFPASRAELVRRARGRDEAGIAEILQALPEQRYRDAAEVARAFGELRSHEPKPSDQPSKRGGEAALESLSAARIASLFEGIDFPASAEALRKHARQRASEAEMAVLERFPERCYHDMSDVARALGEQYA